MRPFSKKISYFLIALLFSNIFVFSYHFTVIPHRWNPLENKFEHFHKELYENLINYDTENSVAISSENCHEHEDNECSVIYFLTHQKTLFTAVLIILFHIFLLKYLSFLLKDRNIIKEVLFFAPKNSPPFNL